MDVKIKVIKRADKQEIEQRRKRAELGLLEIYIREMAAKYPDSFKRLCEKICPAQNA